jgi:RNA polymerase sigma factor (sigma-70 family)
MNLVALDSPRTVAAPRSAPGEEWTDVRLVRECLDGNETAWAALLDKYKRLIYSIPVKYGFSPDESTDIFQDVCVELLSELPRLREPRALPKWLMQVTAHKCGHLTRRDRRLRQMHDATFDGAEIDRIADDRPVSDEILSDVEREQALRDAVLSLSPRCRQLVQMLFFESPARPYKEIAESLGMACGSIGFIRGRCLQRLRAQLRKNGFR